VVSGAAAAVWFARIATNNLATCLHHAATLQQHREILRGWCARTGDRFRANHYGFGDQNIAFMIPGDSYPIKPALP
jgi:hypothetical protein